MKDNHVILWESLPFSWVQNDAMLVIQDLYTLKIFIIKWTEPLSVSLTLLLLWMNFMFTLLD